MAAVASKNLYDLLGNDVEDENDVPKPPTKEIVKKTTSSKKRDEPPVSAPQTLESNQRTGGYGRRPRGDGNEAAFRDRGNGRQHNRSRPTDETGGFKDRTDRPFRSGRGGGRGRGREFDRHSATNRTDSDKQVAQGWGSNKGPNEWNEEQAGETIAHAEAAAVADGDGQGESPEALTAKADNAPEPEEEQEPEDKTISYAQYAAEQVKKLPVEELPEARVANEGARENKKWATAKELVRGGEADVYFSGEPKNQKAQRQRKEKNVVEIDQRYVDPRDLRRGGGERSSRGRNAPPRDTRPTRGRGDYRGSGRGARPTGSLNVSDEADFPSLGGK